MAGFTIHAEPVRGGRTTANTTASLVDAGGRVRVTATATHLAAKTGAMFEGRLDNAGVETPHVADAAPGDFPIGPFAHGLPGFRNAVEVRYPPGESPGPGATTVWMHTIALLPGEEMTPFQRICPLADCGNAFSRHAEPEQVRFVNIDLVIALHRDPLGEWMGSRATSAWQPSGIGLVEALLFDDEGPVGRALQTLILRPASSG